MSISKPRWREFNTPYSDGVLNTEYYDSIEKVLDMCLRYVDSDKERWLNIIGMIDLFWSRFDVMSEKLQNACGHLCEKEIFELCDKLREQISSHRQFMSADWSAPKEYIDKWESLLDSIMPDTIGRFHYLLHFNPHILTPIPYDKEIPTDYEQSRMEVFKLRKTAFETINEKYGEEAVIEFCAGAEDVQDWGQIITESILRNKYDFGRLRDIRQLSQTLYSAVLWDLYSKNSLDVLLSTIKQEQSLKNDEIGEIMCYTPLNMEVWSKLEAMDKEVSKYYWENVRTFRLLDADDQAVEHYIGMLLKYGRPFSAINAISYTNYDNSQSIMSILLKYLEFQEHTENNGLSAKSIGSYEILKLFEKLYEDFNLDDMDIARLEVAYMPFFRFDGKPKGLTRCFKKMPELYVEFISIAFKPDNEDIINSNPAKAEHIVRSAHDAIERFSEIPGCNENLIDENSFKDWMYRAERIAFESGYIIAYEICLGRLLSYSPLGSDGIFPHEIIRDYLETRVTETVTRNFVIGKMNQRGVHGATYGEEEKRIAQKYKDGSSKMRIKHPKTASILDRLSEYYLDDSRRDQLMEYEDFYI